MQVSSAHAPFVVNATNRLTRVMCCSPIHYKFNRINVITAHWMDKGDCEHNDVMVREWQSLVETYQSNDVEVLCVEPQQHLEEMTFARDYGAMIAEGAILGRMHHPVRQPEVDFYGSVLKDQGIPVVAQVEHGCFEGGDFWMLDEQTLAIGTIARTNEEGIEDLQRQLAPLGYRILSVPSDPKNLHLDMIFNIVAPQVALAALDELPNSFIAELKRRKFELIPVDSPDVFKHGCNAQALGDERVLAIEKNGHINDKMRALGLTVIDVPLDQILHAGGGIHCLTQPLKRV